MQLKYSRCALFEISFDLREFCTRLLDRQTIIIQNPGISDCNYFFSGICLLQDGLVQGYMYYGSPSGHQIDRKDHCSRSFPNPETSLHTNAQTREKLTINYPSCLRLL